MREHDSNENGKDRKFVSWTRGLEILALIFACVSGAASSGLLVFKGGRVVEHVDAMELRLAKIENTGSPPMSEHKKLDDERNDRTRTDIARMEGVIEKLRDVPSKVDGLATKLDILTKQIERQKP